MNIHASTRDLAGVVQTILKETDTNLLFDREHALPLDMLKEDIANLRELSKAIGNGLKISMNKPNWVV